MGEKGVGKLSRETPPPREGEPMGAQRDVICIFKLNDIHKNDVHMNQKEGEEFLS